MFSRYSTPFFISILIGFINGFTTALILFIHHHGLIYIIVYSSICILIVSLISFTLIDKMLYKKIKNIYKLILNTKSNKKEKLILQNTLPQKDILEVEKDIKNWTEKEAEELEFYKKLTAFKREFLQNISHELKTPLFSIQAYCENLEIQIQQKMPQNTIALNFIEVILRNISRLSNLTNDINLISHLEGQDIKLNKQSFYLEPLIKDVLEELNFHIINKKIEIVYLDSLTEIIADKDRIKQVLINIIDNAIKHNSDQTKITFKVNTLNTENIILEISDNGKGIEEIHLTRLFERFYRADNDRNREVGGSGLGLSICKHIMELHNSFIHVRSKVGIGTTFMLGLSKKTY